MTWQPSVVPEACPLCRRADGHTQTCLVLLAMQIAGWVEEGMNDVRATLADTPALPLDPVERDRAAVAAVVAGWDTREPRCEHGATVTEPARVVSTSGHTVGTLVSPLTYCLDCHQLTPAQEDTHP